MNILQAVIDIFKNVKTKKYYRPKLIVLLLSVAVFSSLPWFTLSEAQRLIATSSLMKTMDKYSEAVFFCIAALLVFQSASFALMLILRRVVVILSAIFESFWEDITMSSSAIFLLLLIISNASGISWLYGFYNFVICSHPLIQFIVEVSLAMNFILSVYVGFSWLKDEYIEDHQSVQEIPSEGLVTYEQYKSFKNSDSNR